MIELESAKSEDLLKFNKDDIICKAGDENYDLYIIEKGKLLIFGNDGTKITPFATLEKGEFLGEISFFDHEPRSAHVVCLENTELRVIPEQKMKDYFPEWLITLAKTMTGKIRHLNDIVAKRGIRKKNVNY